MMLINKMTASKTGRFIPVILVIVLDQLSKLLSNTQLTYGQAHTVFPGFDLLLVYNHGAAFSFLGSAGGWQRWLFTGISLVVSAVLFVWLLKLSKWHKLQSLAMALILGGAIGNLIDRLYLGYVIDFISVYAGSYRFATFNIADAGISVGAALLILDVLLDGRKRREQ